MTELKDTLWRAITDENNRLATPDIVHRPLDGHHRVREEDDYIFEYEPGPEEDEDLQSISPESWGADEDGYDWDEDVEPED